MQLAVETQAAAVVAMTSCLPWGTLYPEHGLFERLAACNHAADRARPGEMKGGGVATQLQHN
jgi:hypothetical protein